MTWQPIGVKNTKVSASLKASLFCKIPCQVQVSFIAAVALAIISLLVSYVVFTHFTGSAQNHFAQSLKDNDSMSNKAIIQPKSMW